MYWDCVPCRGVEPMLREGDLVIVKEVPPEEVEVSDIIASDTHHTDLHNQGLKAQFKSLIIQL